MEKDFKVQSDIYSLDTITQAIRDFSDVSDIIFKNDMLSISGDSDEECQEIFNEFMNYVLSL